MKAFRFLVLLALLALPVAVASCGDSASPGGACAGKSGVAGTREIVVSSGGLERRFQISVPSSALRGDPVPLVVVYHGVFSDGVSIQSLTRFPEKAAEQGFITAAGDGTGRSWNAGLCCQPSSGEGVDDVGFTRELVGAIEREYCVDESRRYATGFSNGAAMVFRLACEASDLFAAFAPVGGSLALLGCAPEQPRPIQIVNNVSDPVVAYALGVASFDRFLEHNRCGAARDTAVLAPSASCEIAPECADGAITELCSVTGLGHDWPGGTKDPDGPFDATDAVWEFLSAHSAEHDPPRPARP